REPLAGLAERHQARVEVVTGTAEEAVGHPRPCAHHLPALDEVLVRPWAQDRGAHRVACGGGCVGEQLAVLRVVLEVVEVRVGPHDVAERGVVGDPSGDGLPPDQDRGMRSPEALDVVAAGTRCHDVPLLIVCVASVPGYSTTIVRCAQITNPTGDDPLALLLAHPRARTASAPCTRGAPRGHDRL